MRNKKKSRVTIPKCYSFMPAIAEFIEKRSVAVGLSQSGYIQKLVEHDQNENVIADAMRAHAERIAVAAA